MIYDREKCIDLCDAGIQLKQQGNFSKALDYYRKAKAYDPTFSPLYMNIAKIKIGLNEFEDAFKHLMTYAHLNFIDPTYNIDQFEMLLPMYLWNKTIDTDLRLQDNLVENICSEHPRFKIIAVNPNLTFNTGLCFAMCHSSIISFNSIKQSIVKNYQQVLLGKHLESKNIRDTDYAIMINLLGFAYIVKNLKRNENVSEIINIYLSDNFTPNEI